MLIIFFFESSGFQEGKGPEEGHRLPYLSVRQQLHLPFLTHQERHRPRPEAGRCRQNVSAKFRNTYG